VKGGLRAARRLAALATLCALAVALLSPWPVRSLSGGLGDGAISFGGCTCHRAGQGGTEGGGTLAMWASDLSPQVGQGVRLLVNATVAELSGNRLVGVFLLRDFTGGDLDRPSTDGWRIETDPNGGRNNYVEVVFPGPGTQVTLQWNLTAPITPGTYRLFTRSQHGGGDTYYEDDVAGLEFSVFSVTPLIPNLVGVRAWVSEDLRAGDHATLYGEFYANASVDIAGFDVAFFVDGAAVGVLENLTIPKQRSRIVSLVWFAPATGTFDLVVRADSGGTVEESSEADNEVTAPFAVGPRPAPDMPGFEIFDLLLALLAIILLGRRRRMR